MLGLGLRIGCSATVLALALPPVMVQPPVIAPGAYKPIPRVGTNVDKQAPAFYFRACPFLNRIHACSAWQQNYGKQDFVNAVDGYPTDGGDYKTVLPLDNPAIHPGVPTDYVCVSSKTGLNFTVDGMTNVVRTPANGLDRVTFTIHSGNFQGGAENAGILAYITNVAGSGGTWDTFYVVRADHEAAYLAGRHFNDDAVRTGKTTGLIRLMDWTGVNPAGNIQDMSQWTPLKSASPYYKGRVPLEMLIGYLNECDASGMLNVPREFTDAGMRQLIRAIKPLLKPTLRLFLQIDNEPWNGALNPGYGYFGALYNPPKANVDYTSSANYGYRAAQMLAVALDEDGYTGQFLPYMDTQATNTAVTVAEFAGVRAAMVDWATSGSAIYNPTFAARWNAGKPLGSFLKGGGPATYLSVSMSNGGLNDADKATIRSWAAAWRAGDPSGLNNYFQQHLSGDLLTAVPDYCLNNLVARHAGQAALYAAENIPMIAYEGGPVHDLVANDVADFYHAARHDPRGGQLQIDWANACFNAGFASIFHYTDVGFAYVSNDHPGDDYGLQEDAWDFTATRYLAYKSVADNPPAPAAFSVSVATSGAYTIGKAPISTAHIVGGQGPYTIAWTGLAPGRVADDFATVAGKLTDVGNVKGRATVTDQRGATAVFDFNQNVIAAPAGYRFFKIKPTASNYGGVPSDQGFRTGSAEIVFRDSAGAVIPYVTPNVVVNPAVTNVDGNAISRVIDGSTANSWITPGSSGGAGFSDYGTFIIDLGDGTAATPASIDIYTVVEASYFRIDACVISAAKDAPGLTGTPDFATISSNTTFVQLANVGAPYNGIAYTDPSTGYARVPLAYPA